MQPGNERSTKILEQWCSAAPRSYSQNCAGCSEQPQPDWNKWPKDIDAVTKRPRTPNDPYTNLNNTMIANITKSSSPHFRGVVHDNNVFTKPRYFRERYADIINKHLLRGQPTSHNFGIITPENYHKEAQEPYTTCTQEAFEKWPGQMAGQLWLGDAKLQKGGLATKSHQFGEVRERFTTIDMYRRPNTNCPGPVNMKYGRPSLGYYLQRYPDTETYFGSEIELNRKQDILQDIWPKALQEYKERDALRRNNYETRDGKWPFISEYSNKYARKASTEPVSRNPRDKSAVEEATRIRRDCELLEVS